MVNRKLRKSLLVLCFTSAISYYDFFIMVLLAPYLSKAFSQNSEGFLSIYAIYAAGGLFWPIGSIVWGHFADRYGRKVCFISASWLLILSTASISIIPTHYLSPLSSSILLLILRCIQGFALGGDSSTTSTLIAELSPPSSRGLFISIWLASTCLGTSLASLMTFLLSYHTPPSIIEEWGWRLPFIVGALMLTIGIIFRNLLIESEIFNKSTITFKVPLSAIIKDYRQGILSGVGLGLLGNVLVGVGVYLPTYAENIYNTPTVQANLTLLFGLLLLVALYPLIGFISDKTGKQKLLTGFAITAMLASIFIFRLPAIYASLAMMIIIIKILTSATVSCAQCSYAELFPTPVRVTGMGLVDSICSSIGSFIPLTCSFLVARLNDTASPAYLLIAAAAVTCLTALTVKDRTGISLVKLENHI